MDNLKKYSAPILRITLSLIFLYFGFLQVYSPDDWAGFVPGFLNGSILSANNIVVLNGIMELTLGILLIIGLYVRFSSLILSIHLFGIMLSLGFNPVGVRDFGLAVATFVVFINGPDYLCIERKIKS